MKIIDKLKKVNLIQFVPAIFVISLVGNSVFGCGLRRPGWFAGTGRQCHALVLHDRRRQRRQMLEILI